MSDIHDLVAPYALDALGPDERDEFEAHLDVCDSCRAEAADLLEGAAILATAIAVSPPPRLKAKVLSEIGRRLPAPTAVPKRGGWRLPWERMMAVAAAAVAIVFAGLWLATSSQLDHAETVASIYAAEDSITLTLSSEVGKAEFVYSPGLASGVFVDQGLATPQGDRVYQLWLVDDTGPLPAGTFRPSQNGVALVFESLEPGVIIAMTEEPAGGSPAPTGAILLSTQLEATAENPRFLLWSGSSSSSSKGT